jgi:Zn-dependent protease with chaperone function
MALDPKLLYRRERALFIVGAVFSSLAWLAIVVSLVGLAYAVFIGLFVMAAHALFLAYVRGNGLRVSELQLPELHARVQAAAQKLGMAQVPEVYVLQSGGILNAFATKLLSRRYVILYSELVDHCEDPRQLDFVIGHELAHHAAGHVARLFFLLPFRMVPLLGAAYSRACEYTCDRAGLFVVEDPEAAMRGLLVLAAGGKLASRANVGAFATQRLETGGFWMAVWELAASHPFLCKRVAALRAAAHPEAPSKPVRRNPFAWPLAPVLGTLGAGGTAGGAMAAVAVIGILAAIAIPNFIKYQERAREARAAVEAAAKGGLPAAPAVVQAGLTQQQLENLQWIALVRQQAEARARGAQGQQPEQR